MANRKLKSLKFPGIDDTYILDAGNVNYSDEETYEEGSVGKGLNALKEDIKDNYAKNDGYYDGMTVGNAEQIVGTVFEEDDTAYNYRTTGGSAEVGDRAYVDAIVGGSLPWNQLVPEMSSSYWAVNTAFGSASFADGECTYTITSKNASAAVTVPNSKGGVPLIENHVYFNGFDVTCSQDTSNLAVQVMDTQWVISSQSLTANQQKRIEKVFISQQVTGRNAYYGIYPNLSVGLEVDAVFKVKNVIMIDLTAMFGSTIADYIYALETAHAGDGVAWFKRYFPKPYYAYHAVGMEHVNAVSAKTVGFNQWDEEQEQGAIDTSTGQNSTSSSNYRSKNYVPVFPNTVYCYTNENAASGARIIFYDENKAKCGVVSNSNANPQTFTTPSDARYLRFYWGDISKVCISIRWDNSRDGDYEPYNLHTYPLADLTLRGIPKKDESGNLYFDGDRYLPDGTVERRYGVKVFDGTTGSWSMYDGAFYQNFAGYKREDNATYTAIGDGLVFTRQNTGISALLEKGRGTFGLRSDTDAIQVYPNDSSIDTDTKLNNYFASHPLTVIYELATPTTEEADPYQYPMVVDNWGTEAFVDGLVESGDRDVAIPVGHETKYPPNLKDKLESAANNPDADGVYVLTHDGGSNTYTPLASNATIQNIIARLEALEGGGE